MLNYDLGRRDVRIDKARAGQFDMILEGDDVLWCFYFQDVLKQIKPKGLAFAFLITASFPAADKGFDGFPSL